MACGATLLAAALPAGAQPAVIPPAVTINASDMSSVVAGLQAAGYKAEIKKNKSGKPYIASATNGSDFSVNFLDCDDSPKAIGCKTLMFTSWWSAQPYLTIALANKFNLKETFGRAYIDEEQALVLEVPVTTVGGLTLETFKDVADWWSTVDGHMMKYVDEAIAATKKPGAPA